MKTLPKGESEKTLPKGVSERIGPYYVYMIIDPETDKPFYVGKGSGDRLLQHGLDAEMESEAKEQPEKIKKINEIRRRGYEPTIDVLRHGIQNEDDALLIEASVIDALKGLCGLTNVNRGHGAENGRVALTELASRYGAPVLDTTEPAVLLTLKNWVAEPSVGEYLTREGYGWFDAMKVHDVYNSNRGWWRIRSNDQPKRVVFVAKGITRCIFDDCEWKKNGNAWVFKGTLITQGKLFDEFVGPLGKKVSKTKGARAPVLYWPQNRKTSAMSEGAKWAMDHQYIDDPQVADEASAVIDSMKEKAIAQVKAIGKWTPEDEDFMKRLEKM